jgi:hypothetical protein
MRILLRTSLAILVSQQKAVNGVKQNANVRHVAQDFHRGIGGHEIRILIKLQSTSFPSHKKLKIPQ